MLWLQSDQRSFSDGCVAYARFTFGRHSNSQQKLVFLRIVQLAIWKVEMSLKINWFYVDVELRAKFV